MSSHFDQNFLHGPQPRGSELWRALRIFFECLKGFRRLHFVGPCVTVYGSARFDSAHPAYEKVRKLGQELAKVGFTVMTGGGPGLMEAANRGAKDVGGYSVGCTIQLPKEQLPNIFLDTWVDFKYFFTRKLMLAKYSYAFIAAPGGFGTLDELFEVITLIQTAKMKDFPVVLLGTDYWRPLVDFLKSKLVAEGAIDMRDIELIFVCDDPVEIAHFVRNKGLKRFGLSYVTRPRWYLLEKKIKKQKPQVF